MTKLDKVIKGLKCCLSSGMNCDSCPYDDRCYCHPKSIEEGVLADALELLKEQEAKPLCCKECSYHRNDGWCNEHGREVKESDYCSFGVWEGR